jgi:hypothetical protein
MPDKNKMDLKMFMSGQLAYWEDYLRRNPHSIIRNDVVEFIKRVKTFQI